MKVEVPVDEYRALLDVLLTAAQLPNLEDLGLFDRARLRYAFLKLQGYFPPVLGVALERLERRND